MKLGEDLTGFRYINYSEASKDLADHIFLKFMSNGVNCDEVQFVTKLSSNLL